jgi:carbonic anhydrase/acetyltransferase-like protein (isoleucine patch superfamily)
MTVLALDGISPELPGEGRYWIAPTASVIGRVRLLPNASVWFGAVLRGDNEWIELGERSQIQDNATLHTDPGFPLLIGSNCVIGHKVVLHGCTIGDNCLVGIGATIMEGVVIGENSIVAGHSYIPDNTLIGPTPVWWTVEVLGSGYSI